MHRWWDNPTMIVTLDAKRRLTVPVGLAPAAPGDAFDARFDAEEDAIIFRRLAAKEDWLEVLKECPVSMDDLPPRGRELPRRRNL
jgi:bifunctional DNA-binding transcriptional regulator/antitoxin component of YhaV-PrlF toxin-antitoxin module